MIVNKDRTAMGGDWEDGDKANINSGAARQAIGQLLNVPPTTAEPFSLCRWTARTTHWRGCSGLGASMDWRQIAARAGLTQS